MHVSIVLVSENQVELRVDYNVADEKRHSVVSVCRNEVPEAALFAIHSGVAAPLIASFSKDAKNFGYWGRKLFGILRSRKNLDMLRKLCNLPKKQQKAEYDRRNLGMYFSGNLSRPKYQ